jgi:hypothetical protein
LDKEQSLMSHMKKGSVIEESILEQYKIFAESLDKEKSRRQTEDAFFLSLNSALIAFFGLMIKESVNINLVGGLLLFGINLCVTWFGIRHYNGITHRAKIKILCEMEEHLHFAPFFKIEKAITEDAGKWKNFVLSGGLIPFLFLLLYLPLFSAAVHEWATDHKKDEISINILWRPYSTTHSMGAQRVSLLETISIQEELFNSTESIV